MNSSAIIQLVNGSNGTTVYTDLDSALVALGKDFNIDMLYLTIYLAVAIAGILGNILSVWIFFRPAFFSSTSPPLFAYLRYEAMIGVVGNLVATLYGLMKCSYTLPATNNYASQWIQSFITMSLYNMSYYAKFLIEIIIVLDRILILAPSFGSLLKLNKLLKIKRTYLVLLTVCSFTVLVNYPYIYLMFAPTKNVLVNYTFPESQFYTYYTTSRTVWSAWGNQGYYPMLFIYIFKNCFTFAIETVLNIFSLVLFQRHLAHKATLVGPKPNTNRHNQNVQHHVDADVDGSITDPNNATTITTNGRSRRTGESHSSSSGGSTGGRKMANLVLIKSVTGFVHNVLLTTQSFYFLNNPKTSVTLRSIQFSAYFATNVRHAINFLQFYFFNAAFHKEALIALAETRLVNRARVQPSVNHTVTSTRARLH
jgi:hypothetical protein